ncbi:MAG: ATP-binding protein [Chloracidobacterium sp.]|nr:ATP-binding protein [Chloracidobacterium sp.]MDW8217679.1 AAA family ATPase [Acidobacteriota bacterium]
MRKKLPIGIQTFREIREEGYYYVDKTRFVAKLAEEGKYYFLARPRRFGKSLFLDTLAEAFAANRALFEGLDLACRWDWSRPYPIIRISFAEGGFASRDELDERIQDILDANAARLGVTATARTIAGRFGDLITKAAAKHGARAVVLVDEYDKPMLDNLTVPETARALRDGLRDFYSVLKAQDAHLRFVFLTGVSKFSKVSLFSGLNNLYDLTLDPDYATLCGYTENEVEGTFAPELDGLARADIRRWYNGYRWLGEPVYNPYDLLLLFRTRDFRAWWFETGTPTFLVEWLKARRLFTPQLERMFGDDELLSAFDVDVIRPEALLWQTGYLTIRERERVGGRDAYWLSVPNQEVRSALNRALLTAWLPDAAAAMQSGLNLHRALAMGDVEALRRHIERLYAGIPHDWYRSNPIAQYEGYYAGVFYSYLAALGFDMTAEDVSQHGQCDLAVRVGSQVYLFEFKVVDGDAPTGAALAQLQARDYAAKYRAPEATIWLIGVEFSRSRRQVVGWQCAAD